MIDQAAAPPARRGRFFGEQTMKADIRIDHKSPQPSIVGGDETRVTIIIPEKDFDEVWLSFASVDLVRLLAHRLDCLATEVENRRALAKLQTAGAP
jgi:hypothetical protein